MIPINSLVDEMPLPEAGSTTGLRRYRDIDAQAACLPGHRQSYQQLSNGVFEGWYRGISLGQNSGFFLEQTNQTLLQEGVVPAQCLTFVFVVNERASYHRVGSENLAYDDLGVMFPGERFRVLCPANSSNCAITVDLSEFRASLPDDQFLSSKPSHMSAEQIPGLVPRLRHSLGCCIATDVKTEIDVRTVRRALTSVLAASVVSTENQLERRSQTRSTFQKCCDIINSNLDNICVSELADRLGLTRRSLEFVFGSEVGMGPSSFIRSLRLNYIRRELSTGSDILSIADIAARWGIWHPSRFAQTYTRMFGELPSMTRLRE
jgi:AraC family ethanolamine operon transcriptional activator